MVLLSVWCEVARRVLKHIPLCMEPCLTNEPCYFITGCCRLQALDHLPLTGRICPLSVLWGKKRQKNPPWPGRVTEGKQQEKRKNPSDHARHSGMNLEAEAER